jgi:RHS repeat-associated protein
MSRFFSHYGVSSRWLVFHPSSQRKTQRVQHTGISDRRRFEVSITPNGYSLAPAIRPLLCWSLLLLLLLPGLVSSSFAQLGDGQNNLPAFGSFSGSNFDIVSLQNGNLHISIPILSVPQRGGKSISFTFIYDTPDYTSTLEPAPPGGSPFTAVVPDQYYVQNGWFLTNSLNYQDFYQSQNTKYTCPGANKVYYTVTEYGVMDPQRSKHPFDVYGSNAPCLPAQPTGVALDGSGLFLNLGQSPGVFYLKDGSRPGLEDTNGNLMSTTSDTLGRNPLTVSNGPTITFTTPLGVQIKGAQYQSWSYVDSNGATQTWTLNNEAIDVSKSVVCNGAKLCGISSTVVVPESLLLPTGASYQFSYDNNSSGELEQVVLPTGGSINYTYSGRWCQMQPDPPPQPPISSDCREAVATRSVSGEGTWKYNFGTVTDPNGNDEVHTYSAITVSGYTSTGTYETQLQYWSGSSASGAGGTVMKTVATQYTGEMVLGGPLGTASLGNVRPISQSITFANGQSSSNQTDYETFTYNGLYTATRMNVTARRDYDFNGSLLRQTKYVYGLNSNSVYTNLNIVDRVTQKTVFDGGGNQVAQTTDEYDNYGHPNQPMVASGAVQHDSNFTTSYTARGNLTAVSQWRNTDGALLTTTKQYDDAGNVLSSIDPLGNMTSFSFADAWSNSTCAPSGQGKAYVTTLTNALKQATTKIYDSCTGALASATDANSQTTSYSYDMMGRTTQVSYPDGGSTGYCYTDVGGLTCTQSPPPYDLVTTKAITSSPVLNEVSTVMYDGLGRVSQTELNSDPGGVTYTQTTYDAIGRKSQVYNPTRCSPITTNCGETTWGDITFNYDPLDRVTFLVEQDGSTVSTNYAAFPCTVVTDEAGKARESCVDGLGRLTSVLEDPGSSPHLNYQTLYQYNALGNLTNVTQNGSNSATARTRTFTYDSLSQLVCAANPEIQNVTCPAFATSTFPAGAVTYKYDNDGNLASKTSPAPNQSSASTTVTLNQNYDALNRLTKKTYTGMTMPTLQYGYDAAALTGCITAPPGLTDTYPIGRRTAMCDGSGATSWIHDTMGRVLQERRTLGAAVGDYETDAYNLDGSPQSITSLGFRIAYTYSGAARALTATNNATSPATKFVSSATYAPPGELVGATLGSVSGGFAGFTVTNAYSDRLQPILLSAGVTGQNPVFSECLDFHLGVVVNTSPCSFSAYTTGNNGNVYQIVNNRDNTRTQNFNYDSLNRIQQAYSSGTQWGETFSPTATSPGVAPSTPGIDAWGNLTNRSGVTGKTYGESLNCPANTNNQLTACSNVYDAAGNMTGYGTASYVYDAENRLIATAGYSYIYDGDGQRVEKCTEGTTPGTCASGATGTLYWRGLSSDPLSETNLAGTVQNNYVFFNGQRVARSDSTPLIHYYFSDHLGSHGVVENATGTTCEQDIDYFPYGGVEEDYCPNVAQNYKLTGKERDTESGLDNFEARYDASSLGRFMTPDPMGGHLENPQSLNKYAYVLNNPTSLTDPTGLDSYLSCTQTKDNASTCQSQTVGYDANGKAQTATVQGVTNADKSFTATQIGNDANGNLVDKTTGTGSYTASANGSGVQFSNNGGQTSSSGVFVNGTPQNTFQDAGFANGGALSGFTFTLTNSKLEAGQTEAGSFTFAGTPDQAGAALQKAGFNPRSGENVGMNEYRSPGSFWTGANSSHFNVFQIGLKPWLSVPQAQGDMHFGEHNPYSPFGWVPHSSEANQ